MSKDVDELCPRAGPEHQPSSPHPSASAESKVFFLLHNGTGNCTAQTCTDGDVEKPGDTFPLFLLSPCAQKHWLDEHFEFLYQINFAFAKKTDCIKIIRLLTENLVTNKVGFFILYAKQIK